jgi:HK97 gp10 family phage protein
MGKGGARLTGDWKNAGIALDWLPASMSAMAHAKLMETGELLLDRMVEHIDKQDLNWESLARYTIEKKGNDKVYVETGWLRDNLGVRRVATKPNKKRIFVGASPWKTHKPSGKKFSELMIMLEYGTEDTPARPLMRPTWEEMQDEVEEIWSDALDELIRKGVIK